ncbi:GL15964 [Drosophila persimilis]|uniref:GL15964 n=1 Tax=Drosophila persimilis TaxID=7234 RepID=B4HD89_DROPE|nr:GL15964 [Drosophila persimilis]
MKAVVALEEVYPGVKLDIQGQMRQIMRRHHGRHIRRWVGLRTRGLSRWDLRQL